MKIEAGRVLIIMNGPTTSNLNWEQINHELINNNLTVIVTNGFMSSDKIIDSHNVIYIINDPLIELILNGQITDIDNESVRNLLIDNYKFDNDHIEAFRYDYKSCKALLKTSNIRIAIRKQANCMHMFEKHRIIQFDFSLLDKLFIKFSYKWHQDGSSPNNILNKLGLKTFPFESRLAKKLIKNRYFAMLWYKINFSQTPNTFYRALDLAIKLNFNQILFIGRNSQIDDWIMRNSTNGGPVEISYSYFFTDLSIKMKVNNFESIIREMYYSSQYINMLKKINDNKIFISLEKSFCYKDFFQDEFEKIYLV
jgi:hypothetical protein